MRNKLEQYLSRATPEQVNAGANWYWLAHAHACELAERYKLSVVKVSGIIAALSPNNKWERNLIDTGLFLETPSIDTKVCTYTANRVKALEIYNLQDEDDAVLFTEVTGILGGRKTKSFFANIYNPLSSMRVTVDLWMFRACGVKNTAKNYLAIEQAIIELSINTGWMPHVIQAVIWSVIRQEYYPRLKESGVYQGAA